MLNTTTALFKKSLVAITTDRLIETRYQLPLPIWRWFYIIHIHR